MRGMNILKSNRIYFEAFAVIGGTRHNLKIINLTDLSMLLTEKVIEGLENAIKLPPTESEETE